jgi:hypothetical protein
MGKFQRRLSECIGVRIRSRHHDLGAAQAQIKRVEERKVHVQIIGCQRENAIEQAVDLCAPRILTGDKRKPHEQIQRIRELRPDMVLISGGTDGGNTQQVVQIAELIAPAKPVTDSKQTAESKNPLDRFSILLPEAWPPPKCTMTGSLISLSPRPCKIPLGVCLGKPASLIFRLSTTVNTMTKLYRSVLGVTSASLREETSQHARAFRRGDGGLKLRMKFRVPSERDFRRRSVCCGIRSSASRARGQSARKAAGVAPSH